MNEWIGAARTEEEAVALGLKKLGLSENQVEVKVLGERTSGLLSLFGFRQVRVRIAERIRRYDPAEGEREEFDRSSHSLEYRRSPRRGDRRREDKTFRPNERDQRDFHSERRSRREDDRRREPKDPPRIPPADPRPGKTPHRKFQSPAPTGRARGPLPPPAPSLPAASPAPAEKRTPGKGGGSSHPPVPPETLLDQWRTLLGWDDLTWELGPVENRRRPATLKTARAERLTGKGSRSLEAFEYLFNLVSSGGDRDIPWVSFHVAGFPSVEESRVVDKALFAAFQVRRTSKAFHLDPMSPGQRRAVHQTLAHHPDVVTSSEGEGAARHVVVKPKL